MQVWYWHKFLHFKLCVISLYVISLLPLLRPTIFARVILFFTGVFGRLKASVLSFFCIQVLVFPIGSETLSGQGCSVGNRFEDSTNLELFSFTPSWGRYGKALIGEPQNPNRMVSDAMDNLIRLHWCLLEWDHDSKLFDVSDVPSYCCSSQLSDYCQFL